MPEIPYTIYRPCSTCADDTCIFHHDEDTHEICVDYRDERLEEAIKEIQELTDAYGNSNLVNGAIEDVLEILRRYYDCK